MNQSCDIPRIINSLYFRRWDRWIATIDNNNFRTWGASLNIESIVALNSVRLSRVGTTIEKG